MTASSAVNWIDQAGTLSYTITRWNIHIVMQTSPEKKDKEYSGSFVRSTNQDFSSFPMANAWRWVVVFSSINLHSFSVMAAGVQPCLGDVTMTSFLTGSTMIALKSSPENKLSMTLAVDILSGGETPILLTENTPFTEKYPIDFSATCTCSMKPDWWWIWNNLLC